MYVKIDKSKGAESKTVANSVTQKKSKGKQSIDFVDNRPEVIAQRKLQAMDNNKNQQYKTIQLQVAKEHNSAPIQRVGWLGTALIGAGITLTGAVVHDLYQRYRRYIEPADRTAEHLRAGGIHGETEDAALNVEQGLDTFNQAHTVRSDRQDDTRAHLSPLGSTLSSGLRAGHSDKDEILMRAIRSEFPGRDDISEEELEFAIQKAIMGSTRTRGSITGAARTVGGVADTLGV